jgi:large subunit ribosomal protein L6
MSKIGKMPITINPGVNIAIENSVANVTGPKGSLSFPIPQGIKVEQIEDKIIVSQVKENDKITNALFGLTRAMLANLVKGVTDGFETKLELTGVGYRAQGSGDTLTLSLGFSQPVIIRGIPGITFKVEENVITVMGMDKVVVGDTAAKIRAIRPPEPYKGKGIKYSGERIRRKVGKAAKAVAGAGGK